MSEMHFLLLALAVALLIASLVVLGAVLAGWRRIPAQATPARILSGKALRTLTRADQKEATTSRGSGGSIQH
jgi:hypothetical protein